MIKQVAEKTAGVLFADAPVLQKLLPLAAAAAHKIAGDGCAARQFAFIAFGGELLIAQKQKISQHRIALAIIANVIGLSRQKSIAYICPADANLARQAA